MNKSKIINQFNSASKKYDSQRKLFLPFFEDYYRSGIIYLSSKKFKTILDLGAGTGLLSQYLYQYFPKAKYTLVDISDKMLSIARKRFEHLPNFNYIIEDYSKKLPENRYDLIASALSIHHLTEPEKVKLYKNVYHSLNKNGFFLNIDQYNSQNESVEKQFENVWVDTILKNFPGVGHADFKSWKERRKLDKETTIENEIQKLKRIGFKDVDCVYKYWKFGVVITRKL